jgi:hypothetical protein
MSAISAIQSAVMTEFQKRTVIILQTGTNTKQ